MIPTAEQFRKDLLKKKGRVTEDEFMIEFAKLHVEAALKAASKLDFESIEHPNANDYEEAVELTILECYPLTNIK